VIRGTSPHPPSIKSFHGRAGRTCCGPMMSAQPQESIGPRTIIGVGDARVILGVGEMIECIEPRQKSLAGVAEGASMACPSPTRTHPERLKTVNTDRRHSNSQPVPMKRTWGFDKSTHDRRL